MGQSDQLTDRQYLVGVKAMKSNKDFCTMSSSWITSLVVHLNIKGQKLVDEITM